MSMLWKPAERTREAMEVYAAAENDREQHPENYLLDADVVVEKALGSNPSPLYEDPQWREGLGIYVFSARNEGRLNALGVKTMVATATGRLRAGHAILEYLKQHPHVSERRIQRPVFIIGGWRTGTTLLQRMLSSAPNMRGVYPMELSTPWRCASNGKNENKTLADGARRTHNFLHLLNPAMKTIHPSGQDLPEECVLAMGTDFKNWGFTSTLRCPTYATWLGQQGFQNSYARYADILRMLQDESGRRWVLKAPAHTGELPSLISAFPDACIIHLHRDVVDTVASSASLFAVFRSTYSDQVDPEEVGKSQLEQTALWLERAMHYRRNLPKERAFTFLDLAYEDLVRDPVAAARLIFEVFSIEWTVDIANSFEAFLRSHPRNKHGLHRYTPEQFGLNPNEIRNRLSGYSQWAGLQ